MIFALSRSFPSSRSIEQRARSFSSSLSLFLLSRRLFHAQRPPSCHLLCSPECQRKGRGERQGRETKKSGETGGLGIDRNSGVMADLDPTSSPPSSITFSLKWRADAFDVTLPLTAAVLDLKNAVEQRTSVPAASVKVLGLRLSSGPRPPADSDPLSALAPPKAGGQRLMVMGTPAAAAAALVAALGTPSCEQKRRVRSPACTMPITASRSRTMAL